MNRFAALTALLAAALPAFAQSKPPLKPKSKAEANAINAVQNAKDPDARIAAAEELITKFADTAFKSFALYLEADAYVQKNDSTKAIVYAEQSLDADPESYQAAVLLTKTYAVTTHSSDLDKADKIEKINKYGKIAIDNLTPAGKPNPNLSDADWTNIKNDLLGQTYLGLGIAAALANKMDDAKTDFDKVATLDSDPTDLIRAGRALMDVKKFPEAVVYLDKAANAPGAPDQIKKIAADDEARAKSMIKK